MSLHSSSSSSRTACEAVQLGKLNSAHQGWLYKYSSTSFLRGWKRRYFVLSDERLYMFKDDHPASYHHGVIDLTTFRSVQKTASPRKCRFGFTLRTMRRPSVFDETTTPQDVSELELDAENESELNQWLSLISKVFVSMDLRAFQSPLSNFDALVQRAGNLSARPGGSILNRIEKRRDPNHLTHSPSSSTLVPTDSARITMTPLSDLRI
ncbi:PH-domain-containing protein [Coemansia reversa NRRL 1564]|uniref:PH-domain-containing protein n=1 Tax=Coemansia reversa (strain ATCC 12441 / NRRL 1564) TaxID=763665 RepID=A0A2G5BL34_COERN|nr:PH-domain-containing protein [Coemansia reversa NRRL 1564]|eukprot:PIA19713.1 PH-domain-containing protein [Coemansia reversa NRRL 1564]